MEVPIYIGRTNNIKRRQSEHNNSCFKKLESKLLYDFIRNETDIQQINLEVIGEFKTKVESKRYEMLIILKDYFGNKTLRQRVPNISDRAR